MSPLTTVPFTTGSGPSGMLRPVGLRGAIAPVGLGKGILPAGLASAAEILSPCVVVHADRAGPHVHTRAHTRTMSFVMLLVASLGLLSGAATFGSNRIRGSLAFAMLAWGPKPPHVHLKRCAEEMAGAGQGPVREQPTAGRSLEPKWLQT